MLRSFVTQSAIIKKKSFLHAINTEKTSQFERTWKCAQQFSYRVETLLGTELLQGDRTVNRRDVDSEPSPDGT